MFKIFFYFSIGLIAITGCQNSETEQSKELKSWEVTALSVKTTSLPIHFKSIGTVVSDQRIDVSSRATGYIKNILVREGDKVSKGQILISLDDSDVEGAIKQAKASVNTAKLAVHDADIDVERYKDLFEQGSISDNRMRKTQLFRDRAHDNLDAAKTALSTAQSQRQYIEISSEVNGVVVDKHLRKGALATAGRPILTIESSQGLFFDTYVAESQISKIKKGEKVSVFIDALNQSIAGSIARVVSAGDSASRRYKVKVALKNHDGLLSGMFGRINFVLGKKTSIVIPESALIERGGLVGVFVIDEHQEAHFRWLNLGAKHLENIEVRAGLQANEKIILSSKHHIREGYTVKEIALPEASNE